MATSEDPEALRDRILQRLLEHQEKAASAYVSPEELAAETGLSVDQVRYHLKLLSRDGFVETVGRDVHALLTELGEQRVREGRQAAGGAVQIGAIIGTMTGNVQAVGAASHATISQVVNDPALFREAIDELAKQFLTAVEAELPPEDRERYRREVEAFKVEVAGRRDPARLKRLLKTLALFGDVEGTLGLVLRVTPCVATAAQLLQQLGLK